MTNIGKSAVDTERKNYCLNKIQDASNHLLGVINDILDMSKIESGKFELSNEKFDFERLLQRVINVITFRSDEKHQKLSVYIDKNIPRTLVGDDQRLTQVITNLVGNAVKFTPDGGSISLKTKLLGDENGVSTIQISITDTGIGISAEQQAKLFSTFQQAESSTTRKYGGTGLGLTISKNIVDMMDGRIWIESELGKGATFTFTFSMKKDENGHGSHHHKDNWNNVRILAVDDDTDILEQMAEIFSGFGVECKTAASGEEHSLK
jgi:signal transduction histidine kinase